MSTYRNSTVEACLSRYDSFTKFYDKIPHLEREIYKYLVDFKMNQTEVASITGLTQGAISHRMSRMFKRLNYLEKLEGTCDETPDQIFKSMEEYCDPFEIEMLKGLYETTSQSHTAFRLNHIFNLSGDRKITQVKLKYAFEKILRRISDTKYYLFFHYINKNLYMLSEVRLPQFDRTCDE